MNTNPFYEPTIIALERVGVEIKCCMAIVAVMYLMEEEKGFAIKRGWEGWVGVTKRGEG